jgi:DUF971 family protein
VQPHFSDGHGTGIYSWDYLRELGANRASLWQACLKRLEAPPERAASLERATGVRPLFRQPASMLA